MRKIKKAVITAAGFGSRFLPVVKAIPKEMLPVVDKPIIQYVVDECIDAGIEEIIIVVRKGNEVIRNYFYEEVPHMEKLLSDQGKSERFDAVQRILDIKGIKIIEQDPELPYGNGSPVISAKEHLEGEEAFAILFADDLVLTGDRSALGQLVDAYEQSQDAEGIMGVQELPDSELDKYGIIKPVNSNEKDFGKFEMLIEKPDPSEAPSNLASYGRFIVPFRIFEFLNAGATGKDGEVWVQDANSKIAETGSYYYKRIEGMWNTTGDPTRYFEAQVRFMLADKRYSSQTKEILSKFS